MKHLFIVNPTAGGKDHTEEVREKVEEAFRKYPGRFEIYVTTAPMDAADKIRQEAAAEDKLHVYACGGDGTFNECCCGAAGLDNVAVCPFPTGTGNDFCRMFGDEQNLYRDVEALIQGWETPIDLIDCNGRYSANICSVGIDARIGTSVHKYSSLPLVGGATAYVISAVVNMFKGIAQHMVIKSGSFRSDNRHTLVCACNGRFYGGGFNPSLDARPDDGIMDVLVVKKVNLFQFAFLIKKYASGQAENINGITHLRTRELDIEFDNEEVVNLDGEALYTKNVHMQLIPKAVKLIVPKGLHFFKNQPSPADKISHAAVV